MRDAGDQLVDIHGQHAHQLLLKGGAQRELLDRHAGLLVLAAEVAQTYKTLSDSRRKLEQAENAGQDIERERERLEWQLEELTELSPVEGEWVSIQSEHARLANGAKIIGGCQEVIESLSDAENSVDSILSKACGNISALAEHDPALSTISEALNSAQIQLDEAIHGLNRYLQKLDLDPARLVQVVPSGGGCVDTSNLGMAQLASFSYFTKLPLRDDPSCNLMLTHNSLEAKAYASLNKKKIELLWEDRRASDRDERLRLYQITPAGKE